MSVTNTIDEILFIVLLITVPANCETNVALGRPAFQSSTFQDLLAGVCVASRAVDGNTDASLNAGSCSSTNDLSGGENWWMVDLGQPMHIKMVVITNRDISNQLNYLIVGVTNSAAVPVRGCYGLCGQYPSIALSGAKNYLTCNPSTASGQYVIVQQPVTGPGLMTLCEVEVYAGQVRNTDLWVRYENQRLMTSGRVVLLKVR